MLVVSFAGQLRDWLKSASEKSTESAITPPPSLDECPSDVVLRTLSMRHQVCDLNTDVCVY